MGEEEDRLSSSWSTSRGHPRGSRAPTRRGPVLDPDEALRLLGQLCQGTRSRPREEAGPTGDIKPQNLLLRDSDDCLKITGLGIARAAEETTRLTRPGKVIGTDRYMAPEQLADGRITAATDVYACRVVADELLPESRSPSLRQIVARCLRDDLIRAVRRRGGELGEALATVEGNGAGRRGSPGSASQSRHQASTRPGGDDQTGRR